MVFASVWLLATGLVIAGFNLAAHALGIGRASATAASLVGGRGLPSSAAPPRALRG